MKRKLAESNLNPIPAEVVGPGGLITYLASVAYDDKLLVLSHAKSQALCSYSFENLIVAPRKSAEDQIDYMNNSRSTMLIRGPPGCGKSTVAWLYLLNLAEKFPDQYFCWVQAGTMLNKRIVLHDGKMTLDLVKPMNYAMIDRSRAAVLVIDGVTSDDAVQFIPATLSAATNRTKLIWVTSQQLAHSQLKQMLTGDLFEAVPWTVEEYKEACSHNAFFEAVRLNLSAAAGQEYDQAGRDELIDRKFNVAGFCARWMFDMTEGEVLEDIKECLSSVDNIRRLFADTVGDRSASACNHLVLQNLNSNPPTKTFTSPAVARALGRLVDDPGQLQQLHRLATEFGNPVMIEQAVEIDFLQCVLKNRMLNRVKYIEEPLPEAMGQDERAFEADFSNTFASPPNSRCFMFHRDIPVRSPLMHVIGAWYIPVVLNQSGYDCVQLVELDGVLFLRFVQVTVQQNHLIREDYMRTFLHALNGLREAENVPAITNMEVVIVVPYSIARNAAAPAQWTVVGGGQTLVTRLGQPPALLHVVYRVAGFKLTGDE